MATTNEAYQSRDSEVAGRPPTRPNVSGSLVLSALMGVVLLCVVIWVGGVWDFLAVTRLLDLLIEGGFVQDHDHNPGIIQGIPDLTWFYMSQDPLDWRLIGISAVLMILYTGLKAAQFHLLAKLYGSGAPLGDHIRIYFYGDGLDRFLPFNIGRVGTALALSKHGLPLEQAAGAVFMSQIFTVFEIVVFAVLGLSLLGWSPWLSTMFWALIVLSVAYYLTSRDGRMSVVPSVRVTVRAGLRGFLNLAQNHLGLFVQLCALSLLAFALFDLSAYILVKAFDSLRVAIYVEPPVLLMGIVGGYIAARLVPVTPGGIGQWEVGFATGLHIGGADVSLAMVGIGFLTNMLRILTGSAVLGVLVLRRRMPTDVSEVLAVFTGQSALTEAEARSSG